MKINHNLGINTDKKPELQKNKETSTSKKIEETTDETIKNISNATAAYVELIAEGDPKRYLQAVSRYELPEEMNNCERSC